MTNCFKKHWFLIIGILLLSNYSTGQSFLSIPDGPVKSNGRPFIVRLNPISTIAEECTSQTITMNIGKLTYLPGSNGPLPVGIVITPVKNGDETTLTISGIVNDGKQGSSLTMDIAMQFIPGTCDGIKQIITATTTNIGCNIASNQSGSVEAESLTPNNAEVKIYLQTQTYGQDVCPRKVLRYRMEVRNDGNQGFNISNAKVKIDLDKCASVLGIYKENSYIPVSYSTVPGTPQIVSFDTPDLYLGPLMYITAYDLYVTYPCLSGNENDCVSGPKDISVYLTGTETDCGVSMQTPKYTTTIQTTISSSCGNVNCDGGPVAELEAITSRAGWVLPCPSCVPRDPNIAVVVNIPPLHPAYSNRAYTIDIPEGFYVTRGYTYDKTACNSDYTVKYIDSQGNKQLTPFAGSLTRKVEFTTNCTISSPDTAFYVDLKYDQEALPDVGVWLPLNVKFTADGLDLDLSKQIRVSECNPSLSLYNQIRKTNQNIFENNFNASAIPGEFIIYRFYLNNQGSGDSNNIINIKLDDRLEYAGGFRYLFKPYYYYQTDDLTPLLGKNSFTLAELGTVQVSTPTYGTTGDVTMSGFNFPCTNNYLFIEFVVRVKDNVIAGTKIPLTTTLKGAVNYYQPQPNIITISTFTYVKSKMFVKCSLADEWNENGINVKNGEVVDFKMKLSNAGSTPVVLSELMNLRPQVGDLFELGSNTRKSTLNIDYSCDTPIVSTNAAMTPSVNFKYAQNSVTMDRDILCPAQSSGNVPIWTSSCDNANWLRATFLDNFTLLPGDYVDVIYKGKIAGSSGTAINSFAFKIGNCDVLSANSNALSVINDNVGIGCNSCTLTNPYSIDMKKLFEDLMRNLLTRKINGETDAQINGSSPSELLALNPYITVGKGDKIYNFVSTVNAQNKITSIKFSFSPNVVDDVIFLEEKGLDYNPEVGAIDQSYLRIDTTVYASADQYLTTCRRTLDPNGTIISECTSKTQIKHIDFCPTRFCYPMSGEIKTGE
jgi:hypothetical protein